MHLAEKEKKAQLLARNEKVERKVAPRDWDISKLTAKCESGGIIMGAVQG
jgi:hypothetical protein